MKRSEINATIKKMEALMEKCRFKLPPYLSFTPDEWAEKNHEYDEIRECELGWDVTDYGEGKFDTLGLALITIRNGNVHNPKYNKPYAEKIMIREIFEKDFENDVLIYKDGRQYKVKAGEPVRIHNGESITLVPYQYHEFIIPEGGPSLIGEVSMVNDDHTDNYFYEPFGRFPTIEEDEKPYRLLCTEYPKAK